MRKRILVIEETCTACCARSECYVRFVGPLSGRDVNEMNFGSGIKFRQILAP